MKSNLEVVEIGRHWAGLVDPKAVELLDGSPFLQHCRHGTVSVVELRTFLVQQYHYSKHFTRFLHAVLANIESEADRLELSENLFDELGLGATGDVPHSQIFRSMLQKFDIKPESEAVLPATQELIDAMFFFAKSHDPIDGLAALCLGAEAIVPHFYSQVVGGFLSQGFSSGDLEFFTIHIENDDDHAVTMKRIIDREIDGNALKLQRLKRNAFEVIGRRRRMLDEISFNASLRLKANPHLHGGLHAIQF